MTLEELKQIHPLTVKEMQSVEDINARLSMRKRNSQADFKFYYFLAAHLGGIYVKEFSKFVSHYECDLESNTIAPARVRISDFISERSIIRRKGMIYLRSWSKSDALKQFEDLKNKNNGKC